MASSVQHDSPQSPSITAEISRSTEGPSAQRWAELKDEIRVLYEQKPLKEVRAELQQKYDFRATYVPAFPSPQLSRQPPWAISCQFHRHQLLLLG